MCNHGVTLNEKYCKLLTYRRNILVVGRNGSGKSSLINNVIGEDCFPIQKGFPTTPSTAQDVCRELLINNNKYQCTLIELPLCDQYEEPPKDWVYKQIPDPHQRESLKRINLIAYVIRKGRLTSEDMKALQYTKIFPQSISAFVVTHCDTYNNAGRARIVEELMSFERTKDIVASMGKGIYTVGFPDLSNFTELGDTFVKFLKTRMQEDVVKLHQLIEESSDSVDILKESSRGCLIM